jgi:hypothetical protein
MSNGSSGKITRLEKAWERLLRKHPGLRAKFPEKPWDDEGNWKPGEKQRVQIAIQAPPPLTTPTLPLVPPSDPSPQPKRLGPFRFDPVLAGRTALGRASDAISTVGGLSPLLDVPEGGWLKSLGINLPEWAYREFLGLSLGGYRPSPESLAANKEMAEAESFGDYLQASRKRFRAAPEPLQFFADPLTAPGPGRAIAERATLAPFRAPTASAARAKLASAPPVVHDTPLSGPVTASYPGTPATRDIGQIPTAQAVTRPLRQAVTRPRDPSSAWGPDSALSRVAEIRAEGVAGAQRDAEVSAAIEAVNEQIIHTQGKRAGLFARQEELSSRQQELRELEGRISEARKLLETPSPGMPAATIQEEALKKIEVIVENVPSTTQLSLPHSKNAQVRVRRKFDQLLSGGDDIPPTSKLYEYIDTHTNYGKSNLRSLVDQATPQAAIEELPGVGAARERSISGAMEARVQRGDAEQFLEDSPDLIREAEKEISLLQERVAQQKLPMQGRKARLASAKSQLEAAREIPDLDPFIAEEMGRIEEVFRTAAARGKRIDFHDFLTEEVSAAKQGAMEAGALPTGTPPVTQGSVRERKHYELLPETQLAVGRLREQLIAAKPMLREEVEAIRSGERAAKVSRAAKYLEEISDPMEAFQVAEKRGLSGRYFKGEFAPPDLSPEDITVLVESIRTQPGLRVFTRINTRKALAAVLDGEVPAPGQLKLLENAFGSELPEVFLGRQRLYGKKESKVASAVVDILTIPKVLRSAWDMSFPLRQGVLLGAGRPKEWTGALLAQYKAWSPTKARQINTGLFDEAVANDLIGRVREDGRKAVDVFFPDVEGALGVAGKMSAREEAYISGIASSLPGIRLSARSFNTMGNKLRVDVAIKMKRNIERGGATASDDQLDDIARFVNVFSGRGSLGKAEALGDVLNIGFWSPRLFMSRIQAPLQLLNPTVRADAARSLAAAFMTGTTMLGLMKASGLGDVNLDPRSPDFGLVRFGRLRMNVWGGYQQMMRYTAQFATGKATVPFIPGKDPETKERTPAQTAFKYARSKLSPGIVSILANEMFQTSFLGENLRGRPVRGKLPHHLDKFLVGMGLESVREQEALMQVVPLFMLELYDAVDEYGWVPGLGYGLFVGHGIGGSIHNAPAYEIAAPFKKEQWYGR